MGVDVDLMLMPIKITYCFVFRADFTAMLSNRLNIFCNLSSSLHIHNPMFLKRRQTDMPITFLNVAYIQLRSDIIQCQAFAQ